MEDAITARKEFATLADLRNESPALSDAFIVANFGYCADIVGIELNAAQRNDLIDEIGQVGWLTMADVKVFLDKIKKRKFYHKDYQEFIAEFWKYVDERLEVGASVYNGEQPRDVGSTVRSSDTLRMNEIKMQISIAKHKESKQ